MLRVSADNLGMYCLTVAGRVAGVPPAEGELLAEAGVQHNGGQHGKEGTDRQQKETAPRHLRIGRARAIHWNETQNKLGEAFTLYIYI